MLPEKQQWFSVILRIMLLTMDTLSRQTGDFYSTLMCIFLFSAKFVFSQVQIFFAGLVNVVSIKEMQIVMKTDNAIKVE